MPPGDHFTKNVISQTKKLPKHNFHLNFGCFSKKPFHKKAPKLWEGNLLLKLCGYFLSISYWLIVKPTFNKWTLTVINDVTTLLAYPYTSKVPVKYTCFSYFGLTLHARQQTFERNLIYWVLCVFLWPRKHDSWHFYI